MTEDTSPLERAARWANQWWGVFWGGASAAALTASGLVDGVVGTWTSPWGQWTVGWSWILLSAGLVLLIPAGRSSIRLQKRSRDLYRQVSEAKEREEAAVQQVFELHGAIQSMLERVCEFMLLELKGTPDDRITLYLRGGDDHLVRYARYSSNPNYRYSGRQATYPNQGGVIGRSWAEGRAHSFVPPGGNRRRWRRVMIESGLDENVVDGLTMRSNSLMGARLEDPSSHRPIAVVVFESLQRQAVLDRRFEAENSDILTQFGQCLESFLGEALTRGASVLTSIDLVVDPQNSLREGF